MATDGSQSVHALVRLLKSSTDIPGPSKIEIASLAWSNSSLPAANKGEVIGEWILLALLGQAKKTRREKNASPTLDPIADPRYWTLLSDVLTAPPPTAARPIKTWLLPLLNRLQLDTIVMDLLTLRSSQVLGPARAALAVLWPLVEKKIGADALADCLVAVCNACTDWDRVDDDLGWICSAVVAAYRNALSNAGNKKKLYNTFLSAHLSAWLGAICRSSLVGPSSTNQLQDSIYYAGIDTLFSLEALKQPLDTLFDALSSSISSFLPVLPKFCTSFLSATQKHRSTLFVLATSVGIKEEVRKRGMEFVGRCWTLIRDSISLQEDFEVENWKSIIGVLGIVEKERLFVAHTIRGMHTDFTKGDYGGELALTEVRDMAVGMLETIDAPSRNRQAEQVVLSIQLLDVLVQIEYDFVGFLLERVLTALINILPPLFHRIAMTSSEFLTHVLEYHTKTRTVHTYALALLSAIAASSTSSSSWECKSRSVMSTFPLAYHLPALAHALRTSLSPTQTAPLATAVLQAVESTWRTFEDADEEGERSAKKRKVSEPTSESGREARSVPIQVRVFSFTGRVAGTILSNLPANVYSQDEEHSLEHLWADVGVLGWTVIWDCLNKKNGTGHDSVKGKEGKKRKYAVETDPLSTLYPHIVATAALRLLYDVRARVSIPLEDCDRLREAQVEKLLNAARDEVSDPELVLQIVRDDDVLDFLVPCFLLTSVQIRTVLWHVWHTHNVQSPKHLETQSIFTVILDILTARPLSELKWSGISADLTCDNLGLAVLYVLTERWIDVLDALASTQNLERLISLLFVVSLNSLDEDARDNFEESDLRQDHTDHTVITLRVILLSLLRNAQFWELHNIRAVFLSSMLAQTAPLSLYCLPTAEVETPPPIVHTDLAIACNLYSLLQYVPPEYFTRPVRTELVKRAMAADVQICIHLKCAKRQRSKTKKDEDNSDGEKAHTKKSNDRVPVDEFKAWSRRLMLIRVFLRRMGQLLGALSHPTSLAFVNHLLCPPLDLSPPLTMLTTVTLDLIELHVISLLRLQEPEAVASVSSVISTLTAAKPFSEPKSQETWTHIIVQSSVRKLIERTTGYFDLVSLSDQVKCAFKALLDALESALSPHVERWAKRDTRELDQILSSEQINAWSRILSLRQWLGVHSQVAAAPFGLKLAISTIRSHDAVKLDSEICLSVFELLFEELWCMPDAVHRVHLDVLVGFYAVNGGERGSDLESIMDVHIARASKKMPVEDFSHLLDILQEAIGGSELRVGHRERLIHAGQVILHDAPQGTLKVIQHFATRCFNLFADQEKICGGSSHLKLHCLEFIARHCSDRPAAIRHVDLGSIWSLLHKTLSGSSKEHDATTGYSIFHHIVTIIGALIRLRRDLIVHTLPQLSLVLRQLMMLTRKIRPQLGAKQSKIVTDTFPSWLSASQSLSTDEARALARLLVSLTTKTIPRTYAYASTESQKAESLAKPFAKHASCVLVAYVDAFNDPLCIINAETRRDLEPGLFALCEMVGEHSRDALMVSALDSGGKTIMKSLWGEYEKQRYVGKG